MKKLLINKKNVTLVIGIAVVMPLLSLMNVQMSVQFGAVIDRMQITSVFIRSLLALIVITALTYFLDKILLSFFLTRLSCNFVTSLHHALIRKFHTMNYPSFFREIRQAFSKSAAKISMIFRNSPSRESFVLSLA